MTDTATPSTPDEPPDAAARIPVPRCRLCVAYVGDAEPTMFTPLPEVVVGPSLAGVPVLASDGSILVLVGHLPDGSTHVWSGDLERLDRRAELDPRLQPVSLVHHRGNWHLFGSLDGSQPYHAVSDDLVAWHVDRDFAVEHPHLRVTGAAATIDGIVVAGSVVANGRSIGWTLLAQDADADAPLSGPRTVGRYRAREITFPLTPEHVVVGPTAVRDDELAMAVSSGTTQLIARTARGTGGRSWTIGLMSPEVEASVVFARGREVWVAGVDPTGGAPMVAVAGQRGFHLDRSGGPVCAAVAHGELLVLARLPLADDREGDPDNDEAGRVATAGSSSDGDVLGADDQSSPAYIDSISAA